MHIATALLLVAVTLAAGNENVDTGLPPPRNGGVYVVAHRGAHDGIPENTLAAYRRAIELGADFVEIDVRTTKDGRLVSIHNATVDAYVTDGTAGPVAEMTLEELRALDIGSRVGPEWAEERVPTLEEILELCKDRIGIYLDLKHGDVHQILEVVRQYGMERHVLWYVGPRQFEQLREACPECLPMPDPGPEALLPRMLERLRPRVVAAVWKHFSPSFVEQCHAAGALVIVDESDATCWEDALAWGADGIQTDDPEALAGFLREKE
jgi:glycerophosphoryl diester phosphodiesterase